VHAVTDALRAPYTAVILPGDPAPAASAGWPSHPEIVVPLSLRGTQAGFLIVAQRTPNEPYSQRDLALHDLARHIAVAAHAATLTRDLQRSRESLVAAREEERRHPPGSARRARPGPGGDRIRPRRGPQYPGDQPQAMSATLAELKTEVQASLADVRRLVYDLPPPALDQLGLVPALQQYAARLAERGALDISVSAPPLPTAVEVAAYRIATEALTNAARHSGARHTSVSFTLDDAKLRA